MAAPTKMIIITSNEDIIRQFSLNRIKNTQIIDLDNDKEVTPIENDKSNIINLNFLAELSQLNSNNDQLYQSVLDSPDHNHNRSKSVKIPKKSVDMTCMICGDRAVGFNYDVLSCASCKAFFRRNANQNLEKMRCVTGQSQCSVAHESRRKCQRCRLDRCFSMGMRKDFILSEEEKQRRRKHLEDNRKMTSQRLSTSEMIDPLSSSNRLSTAESLSPAFDEIDRIMMDVDIDNSNILLDGSIDSNEMEDPLLKILCVEDWIVVQNVRSSYLSIFQTDVTKYSSVDVSNRTSALICWSQIANQIALCFINFFRRIDEFESLNGDDRFILIKYNVFPLFPLFKCVNRDVIDNCFSCAETEEAIRKLQFYKLCFDSNGLRDIFLNLVVFLLEITEQDAAILSLLLVILLFSQGLSMNEDEPSLKDSIAVNRAQSYYTRILWNYMINKQGETKTCKQFIQLLTAIFRIQSTAKIFRQFFRDQFPTPNTVDQIAPLMQTVLHIS